MDEQKPIAFTLPNGHGILIGPLEPSDYHELNQWIKTKYLENVTALTKNMGAYERQEFLLAALDQAASLSFQYGTGRQILSGNCEGMARFVYQLLKDPQLSFKEFEDILFPEGFITTEGVKTINEMTKAVYPENDFDATKVIDKITEESISILANGVMSETEEHQTKPKKPNKKKKKRR